MYARVVEGQIQAGELWELFPDLSFKVGITDDELAADYQTYPVLAKSFDPAKEKLSVVDVYEENGSYYNVKIVSLSLNELKAIAAAYLSHKLDTIIANHYTWNGHKFKIDDAAANQILFVRVALLTGMLEPTGGVWPDINLQLVQITDEQAITLIDAMFDYRFGAAKTRWLKLNAVQQAASIDALSVIDLDADWPQNGS